MHDDPVAERAGLTPEWRADWLAVALQLRRALRDPDPCSVRWRSYVRRRLKGVQRHMLAARRAYRAARRVRVHGRIFYPHVRMDVASANRFIEANPGFGVLHEGRHGIIYLARKEDMGVPA